MWYHGKLRLESLEYEVTMEATEFNQNFLQNEKIKITPLLTLCSDFLSLHGLEATCSSLVLATEDGMARVLRCS